MDGMLARIPSRLLSEWMAYASIEPFGEERADSRMAIIAALLANANRDTKKRTQPYTPGDFMPRFDVPQAEPDPSDRWRAQKAAMMKLSK